MQRQAIERLLPGVIRRTARAGSPLHALLQVMEGLHAPSEAVLDGLERYFDPYRAPNAFVPFLAHWVDLDRLLAERQPVRAASRLAEAIGTGRLRELVAAAAHLSRWRGTSRGLALFLETGTGEAGFAIEERVPGPDGIPRPFHIRVRVPPAALPHLRLVERIVELEKPAYVTYEIAPTEAPGREES